MKQVIEALNQFINSVQGLKRLEHPEIAKAHDKAQQALPYAEAVQEFLEAYAGGDYHEIKDAWSKLKSLNEVINNPPNTGEDDEN